MNELDTIKKTIERAQTDGLNITEHALRQWIKRGDIPVRMAGRTALVYYPNLKKYLMCDSATDGNDLAERK